MPTGERRSRRHRQPWQGLSRTRPGLAFAALADDDVQLWRASRHCSASGASSSSSRPSVAGEPVGRSPRFGIAGSGDRRVITIMQASSRSMYFDEPAGTVTSRRSDMRRRWRAAHARDGRAVSPLGYLTDPSWLGALRRWCRGEGIVLTPSDLIRNHPRDRLDQRRPDRGRLRGWRRTCSRGLGCVAELPDGNGRGRLGRSVAVDGAGNLHVSSTVRALAAPAIRRPITLGAGRRPSRSTR